MNELCGKICGAKVQREVADPMAAASREAPVAESMTVNLENPRWLSRPIWRKCVILF